MRACGFNGLRSKICRMGRKKRVMKEWHHRVVSWDENLKDRGQQRSVLELCFRERSWEKLSIKVPGEVFFSYLVRKHLWFNGIPKLAGTDPQSLHMFVQGRTVSVHFWHHLWSQMTLGKEHGWVCSHITQQCVHGLLFSMPSFQSRFPSGLWLCQLLASLSWNEGLLSCGKRRDYSIHRNTHSRIWTLYQIVFAQRRPMRASNPFPLVPSAWALVHTCGVKYWPLMGW